MTTTTHYVIKKEKSNSIKMIALVVGITMFAICITAGIVVLFIDNRNKRIELENIYQRAYYELADSVNSLETGLSKMMVSNSSQLNSELSMEVYKSSQSALDCITSLPVQRIDVASVEKFFNQTADFALSYNRSLANKKDTVAYSDKIEDMYITARAITALVMEEGEELRASKYSYSGMLKRRQKQNRLNEASDNDLSENKFSSVESPELIYDGPFSDSTSKRCYKALENLEEISYESACEKIRAAYPYEISNFYLAGESSGMAPSYQIFADTALGQVYFMITKAGGIVLNVAAEKNVTASNLSEENARAKAKEYTSGFGFDVEPVWYNVIDNIAIINFAPVKNDIVCYTDLIKVKIALDNGDLLGMETNGYCMNNCERDYKPTMTADSAKSMVSSKLTINSVRLAVIPDGSGEVLSYEVAAEYKGLDYFIYLDAKDGREVNILRVIDEDQGKMTI